MSKPQDTSSISIMLVDDHAMLREGLRAQFERNDRIQVAAEAGSIAEMMNRLSFVKPDILILDSKLPDGSGISHIPAVKEKHPDLGVIILTMYDHGRYAEQALQNQADGYVLKGEPFEELIQAVETVYEGGQHISSQIAPRLKETRRTSGRYHLDNLSKREFEAFSLLSRGLSLRETARSMGISEKSVSTYRARLMSKLELSSNADMVRLAMEAGIAE